MKQIFTTLFCIAILSVNAQQNENKKFIGMEYNSGIIHSQLAILNNGLKISYGITTGERSVISMSVGFNYAKSVSKDQRACRILQQNIGLDGKLPMYEIVLKQSKIQTYIDGGFYFNFNNLCSSINDNPCNPDNQHYASFKIGGSAKIPINKSSSVKFPFLNKSEIYVNFYETGYLNNNVSSFYKEYSNIGSITWGQEISIALNYQIK